MLVLRSEVRFNYVLSMRNRFFEKGLDYRKFGESCKQTLCFGFAHAHKFKNSRSGAKVVKAIPTECVDEIDQSAKTYEVGNGLL